jgi:hypothetical protein
LALSESRRARKDEYTPAHEILYNSGLDFRKILARGGEVGAEFAGAEGGSAGAFPTPFDT